MAGGCGYVSMSLCLCSAEAALVEAGAAGDGGAGGHTMAPGDTKPCGAAL